MLYVCLLMNCFSFDLKLLFISLCSYQDIFPGFGIPLGNMFYFLQGWHCSFFLILFQINCCLLMKLYFPFFLNNTLFLSFFSHRRYTTFACMNLFLFLFSCVYSISMIWNNNFKKYGNASSRTLSNI